MKVYVDANPKRLAAVPEEGDTFVRDLVGIYTNNQAEYLAVLYAILEYYPNVTEIISDSQLVVNQLNRKFNIKQEELRKYALAVWNASKGKVKFSWISRENNPAGKLLG